MALHLAARKLLAVAAITTAAFGSWSASAAEAPNLITPPECQAPQALGLAGVPGVFSVDDGVRYCTVVQLHYAVTMQLPGTEQTVVGPGLASLCYYHGSYTQLTVYERTTVYSQMGAEPIQTEVTDVQKEQLDGWSCQRELRDAITGILLEAVDPDRPISECLSAGVYVGLPTPP